MLFVDKCHKGADKWLSQVNHHAKYKGQALVEPMDQPKQGYQQQHEETKNLNYFWGTIVRWTHNILMPKGYEILDPCLLTYYMDIFIITCYH